MRFLGQPPSVLVATLATLTALIFQLISLASTGWVEIEVGGVWRITEGLWEQCNETLATGESSWCGDIPLVEEWLEATRAYGVVAVLLLFLCMFCIVPIFFLPHRRVFGVIAPISAGTACFFLLMEFAFYADNVRKSNTLEHDYCFYLCIVAWILSFVAAVLLVDGRRRSSAADSGYTNVK